MEQAERTQILQSAIDTYGTISQLNMVLEECAELMQAVCKLKRGGGMGAVEHLCEEVADVQIMLDQVKLTSCGGKVADYEEKKLLRLKGLVEYEDGTIGEVAPTSIRFTAASVE